MHDPYRDLIASLAHLVGLSSRIDHIDTGGELIVNGVALTLQRSASVIGGACDRIDVFVDFGAYPEERGADILRRLLEVNLLLASAGTARLGVDGDTGRVVLAWQQLLRGLTAEGLRGSLVAAVEQALEWRSGFYLDPRAPLHGGLHNAIAV